MKIYKCDCKANEPFLDSLPEWARCECGDFSKRRILRYIDYYIGKKITGYRWEKYGVGIGIHKNEALKPWIPCGRFIPKIWYYWQTTDTWSWFWDQTKSAWHNYRLFRRINRNWPN